MAMSAVPPAFLGMGAVMTGLYWFCQRREKLRRQRDEKEGDE
jgi:hypothetical protein